MLNAIFMAIIQAITAIFPTSENGHIDILNNFANRQQNAVSITTGWIEIGIAIGIIIALYKPIFSIFKEVIGTIKELCINRSKLKHPTKPRKFFYMALIPLPFTVLWAIPTGKGNNLYGTLSSLNCDNNVFSEGLFFILTALLLMVLYIVANKNKSKNIHKGITPMCAVLFGLLLIICVPIGGLSYTVIGMLLLALFGVNSKISFRYTYVLAVPILIINGIINICASVNSQSIIAIIFGVGVSIIIAFFAVKIAKYIYVNNKTDKFSLYNLTLGIIVTIIGVIQFFAK